MSQPRDAPDPRLTLARPHLAAASLEGVVAAARYKPTPPMRAAAPLAPIHRAADPASERIDELIYGETFEALAEDGGFVWGQARRDGCVGYVVAAALAPIGRSPTHRVAAISATAYAEPLLQAAISGPFSLNALVRIEAAEGSFGRAEGVGWFHMHDLAPIGRFERHPAAVAERFLGAPYLPGGRTNAGLDAPALIQQALYACGHSFPRDADQQLAEGREIGRDDVARGDLVGWVGHIGMLLDDGRLIHASDERGAVVIEALDDAIARVEAARRGPVMFRRL